MLVTGQPPVRRRGQNGRGRNNRAARIAVPVTAAVALSLGAGIFVASSGGGPAKVHAAAASSSQSVTSGAVNTNCDIIVPAHPLTAKGLATPYQLTGHASDSPGASGCQMINSIKLGAFVQATILDTQTGALYVYNPLVVTRGTRPAVAPVVPKLPSHAVVTIDIGFNGEILRQVGATPNALREGNCTDGEPGSPFGQVSLCNGPDNGLIDNFLDPALGCTPLKAPDLGNHGVMSTSQALDELLAARNEPTNAALIPENDGMVTDIGGNIDLAKADLYRSEIGQPLVNKRTQASSGPQMFCQNLDNFQTPVIAAHERLFAAAPSPVPTAGDTLYTFLASRLAGSFDELNCANFGLAQPVTGIVTDGAGAATQVTMNTAQQVASF